MVARGIDCLRGHTLWYAGFIAFGLIAIATVVLNLPGSKPGRSLPMQNPSRSTVSRFPLEISPNPVSLGSLNPGQVVDKKIVLSNPWTTPVTIQRIETSCPCLEVAPVPIEIASGRSGEIVVRFNSTEDPDYRGVLGIEVTGYNPSGKSVMEMRIDLEIK